MYSSVSAQFHLYDVQFIDHGGGQRTSRAQATSLAADRRYLIDDSYKKRSVFPADTLNTMSWHLAAYQLRRSTAMLCCYFGRRIMTVTISAEADN